MNEKLKFADKKEMDKKDYLTMLEETASSMQASLKNLRFIIEQQDRLYTVVEKAKDKEFETFLKDLKANTEEMNEQSKTLSQKLNFLEMAITFAKKEESNLEGLVSLIKAFGIFA